jgi:hypothetical protein
MKNAIRTYNGNYWTLITTCIQEEKLITDILMLNTSNKQVYIIGRSEYETYYFEVPKQWQQYMTFRVLYRLKFIDERIPCYRNVIKYPYNKENIRVKEACKLYLHEHANLEEIICGVSVNTGINGSGMYMSNIITNQHRQICQLKDMFRDIYKKEEKADENDNIDYLLSESSNLVKELIDVLMHSI